MLKKILNSFIPIKHSHSYRMNSSSYKHRHPSKYGYHYYKKRHGASSFFSSYSS